MLKLCGNNYFCQLNEKSNNKSIFGTPVISPSINSQLDVQSISSFSFCGDQTVIITSKGEVQAVGDNTNRLISTLLPTTVIKKFTKFEIRDSKGHLYYPLLAVCGDFYTLYMVSLSKDSNERKLVYTDKNIESEDPIFLNIGNSNPVSIFGGLYNSVIIDTFGSIIYMPVLNGRKFTNKFTSTRLPDDENPISVACCSYFIVALSSNNRVFISTIKNDKLNFKLIEFFEDKKIVKISGINCHCFATSKDGKVFGFGSNENGELGIGKGIEKLDEFTEISSLSKYKIKAAYAGVGHSLFQTVEGKILACGQNGNGELFLSPSENVFLPTETEIKEGATFCVAGYSVSAVFIGYDPLMSSNRRIVTQKATKQLSSDQNVTQLTEQNTQLKDKIKVFEETFSLTSSQKNKTTDNDYYIDEDYENEFHINMGPIGEGNTSIAYKIIDKRTKRAICKKVLKYKKGTSNIEDAKRAMKEFETMHSISHPCICKAIGINIAERIEGEKDDLTTIAIFLEFLDYSLDDVLKMKISGTTKAKIVLDIVHAMNHLHKNGMIHRDLKIENIMLNSLFETKIADFGLVKVAESFIDSYSFVGETLTKKVGSSLLYMSPEMANEDNYNEKTDVYSFGIVLHYIFVGNLPKQSLTDKLNGKKIKMPSPSDSISPFCIQLIDLCLSYSPSKRPSFEQILIKMRESSYELAPDVDPFILSKHDKELDFIENYK